MRVLTATLVLLMVSGVVFSGERAAAMDGYGAPETYYENQIGTESLAAIESTDDGLPDSLYVTEAAGGVEYRLLGSSADGTEWEVFLELEERAHERVDTVYDLVLALPLPDAFTPAQWGITAKEGTEGKSVAIVYGGEKVVLKRNVTLEKSWLGSLVASGALPDLSGSGYSLTLWDAILRYDPAHGPTVQALASLRYSAAAGVAAPDPANPAFGGYLITWIPTLQSSIPPYTLRLDVRPPTGN